MAHTVGYIYWDDGSRTEEFHITGNSQSTLRQVEESTARSFEFHLRGYKERGWGRKPTRYEVKEVDF